MKKHIYDSIGCIGVVSMQRGRVCTLCDRICIYLRLTCFIHNVADLVIILTHLENMQNLSAAHYMLQTYNTLIYIPV